MYLLFSTVMLLARRRRFTREPEGVGFEPTVGFPTLDFESSALNRAQPPFRNSDDNAERATSNIQRSMQLCSPYERLALSISISGIGGFPAVVHRPNVSGFTPRVRVRQNRQSAASSLKSLLHPTASTAASSLRLLSYEHTLSVFRSFVFDRS